MWYGLEFAKSILVISTLEIPKRYEAFAKACQGDKNGRV